MKNICISIIIFFWYSTSFSQKFEPDTIERTFFFDFESINIDTIDIEKLNKKLQRIKELNDSINTLMKTDSLFQLACYYTNDTTQDYNSWYILVGPAFADIQDLNSSLRSKNLPVLKNMHWNYSYLFAFSYKRKRKINDFYIGFIHGRSEKHENLKIGYSCFNLINYKFGYSIIDSKYIDIYPYAGVDIQFSDFTIDNRYENNPSSDISSFDTLLTFVANNNEGARINFSKPDLLFNYGIELDIHTGYSKRKGGVVFGFRGGRTVPIINTNWRFNHANYTELPPINLRDYYINLVIKFYWKKSNNNIILKNPYY